MSLSKEDKAEIVDLVAEVLKASSTNSTKVESNVDVEVKKATKPKSWNMSTKKLADGKYRITIDVDPAEPGEPYQRKNGQVSSFQLAGAYGTDFDLPFTGVNGNAAKLQMCIHYAATKETK